MPFDFILPLLNRADGKDKILRFIQYFTILRSRFHRTNEKIDLAEHYLQVSKRIYDLRRLTRLMMSISHYPKLKEIIMSLRESENKYGNISLMISHFAYSIFVLIDNIAILSKIKFFKWNDHLLEKTGFAIWLIGLLTSLLSNIFKIRLSFKAESELKTTILNNMTPQAFFDKLNQFSAERKTFFFNATRNICDSIVALNKLDLPRIVIRTNINPILVGLCGMTATVISIIQVYEKELKPKNLDIKNEDNHYNEDEEERSLVKRTLVVRTKF